jgi:hypothetical protein
MDRSKERLFGDQLVDLGSAHSYKIVYIGRFGESAEYCKVLKINGRGERI